MQSVNAFLNSRIEKQKQNMLTPNETSTNNPKPSHKESPAPEIPITSIKKDVDKKRKRSNPDAPVSKVSAQHFKKEITKSLSSSNVVDPPLNPSLSIFAPNPETATTTVIMAPSYSGKTTMIASELNKLTEEDLMTYSLIVLFTPNVGAAPLKNMNENVLKRMAIFDIFIPEVVTMMKKTNTLTRNRYRYLVIMDDCLKLRNDVVENMILTLRNSGVSTVLSIQYSKLISPGQRQSVHDYYFINLKLPDLEYIMYHTLSTHIRDLLSSEGDEEAYKHKMNKLALILRQRLKGKILHYDQRHDTIKIHTL
jgi:hypothetical protein